MKKFSVSEGSFPYRLHIKSRQMQREAECSSDLSVQVNHKCKLCGSLVKMREVTIIISSNYASSYMEEFQFFSRNLDIPQILQKFVISHLEMLQHLLELPLIHSILLLLSSLPTDRRDHIQRDKCEVHFRNPGLWHERTTQQGPGP